MLIHDGPQNAVEGQEAEGSGSEFEEDPEFMEEDEEEEDNDYEDNYFDNGEDGADEDALGGGGGGDDGRYCLQYRSSQVAVALMQDSLAPQMVVFSSSLLLSLLCCKFNSILRALRLNRALLCLLKRLHPREHIRLTWPVLLASRVAPLSSL